MLAEELSLTRQTARRFVEREVVPHCEDWRAQGRVDPAAWRAAGAAGLLCASVPQAYGGIGGDFRHEVVIIEELARVAFLDFAIPLHNGIVAPYLVQYGTEAQKRRWLPRLATGELIGAIAMTEPDAGSDLRAMTTRARLDGDHYVLSGQKTFITNGQIGNLICVAAKTDPTLGGKGISLLMLETERAEGFRRGRALKKVGMTAQDTSELFFDDVRVPVENRLGAEGEGFAMLTGQLPQERLIIAVQAIATIETALAHTIGYVKERKAFNKHLIDFQNTRFRLAEAKSEAEIARVYVDQCVARLVEGELDGASAAIAKWWVTDRLGSILDLCVQLHGGNGYMLEYPVARMWADARAYKIYGGTNEIMKELIARTL
jgi:acyl-CoA dehydrogenase